VDTLAGETVAERSVRSNMLAGRADVIVGGAMVLSSVMRLFECSKCLMSEDDILDGLVASIS
jgi:exopolyphosphatase/pppGpp-phosphohydrolase